MVLDALKCGNDISLYVLSQIPDTCSLGSGTIRLSLNNISLLPTPALGLGMGMVETMHAEPKFAVHPCYLLYLVTHDSFDQKRNNTACQWTFIHSFIHGYFLSAYYDEHCAKCWETKSKCSFAFLEFTV